MSRKSLSDLQLDLLRALGNLGSGFFLTGGSVLVNLLGHRTTTT